MPTYEYQCTACGHCLEAMQRMSDAPLAQCPACAEKTLRKLISASAFHLKGSGWYQTDFKNAGKKVAAVPKTDETVSGGKHDKQAEDKQANNEPKDTAGGSNEKVSETKTIKTAAKDDPVN